MKATLTGKALEQFEQTTKRLKSMTKEERLKWFEESSNDDFAFGREIDGTIYIARGIFNKPNGESILEKTRRIVLKDENM